MERPRSCHPEVCQNIVLKPKHRGIEYVLEEQTVNSLNMRIHSLYFDDKKLLTGFKESLSLRGEGKRAARSKSIFSCWFGSSVAFSAADQIKPQRGRWGEICTSITCSLPCGIEAAPLINIKGFLIWLRKANLATWTHPGHDLRGIHF